MINDHNCTQICVELEGSFSCSCYPGYELQQDEVTCEGNQINTFTSQNKCLHIWCPNNFTIECDNASHWSAYNNVTYILILLQLRNYLVLCAWYYSIVSGNIPNLSCIHT